MGKVLINKVPVKNIFFNEGYDNIIVCDSIKEEFFGISTIKIGQDEILCEHLDNGHVRCIVTLENKEYQNVDLRIIVDPKAEIGIYINPDLLTNPTLVKESKESLIEEEIPEFVEPVSEETEILKEELDLRDREVHSLRKELSYVKQDTLKKQKLKKTEFVESLKSLVEENVAEYRQKILEDFLSLSAEQKAKSIETTHEAILEIKQETEESCNTVIENLKLTTDQLLENIIAANEEQTRIKEEYIKNTVENLEVILRERHIVAVDELKNKSQEELKEYSKRFLDSLKTKLEGQKEKDLKQLQETVNETVKNDLSLISDKLLLEVKNETDKNLLDVYDKLETYKINVKEEIASLFEEREKIINANLSSSFNDKLLNTKNEFLSLYITSLEKTNNDLRQEINEQIAFLDNKISSKKVEQVSFDSNELVAEAVKQLIEEDDRVGNRLKRFKDTILKDLQQAAETYASNANKRMMRYAEMMSGGGSTAVQYANGGTMNGDLNVIGNISSNNLIVNSISATSIEAVSANITFIDIKTYELSGFEVTGNVSISGDVTTTGVIYSSGGNSNNWNTAYNISTQYQATSSTFATNSLLQSTSALLTPLTLTNTLTSQLLPSAIYINASGNWQSAYSTVLSNSATTWNYQGTDLKALSTNWQSTFTSVQSNSSNWNNAYNTGTVYQSNSGSYAPYSFVNSNFLNLTGGAIEGDLSINGNFYVAGSAANINVVDLVVTDPLIYLAEGNPSDILDIGITGSYNYNSEPHEHTGLVRSHIDKKWTLFSGLSTEILSSLTINFNDPSLQIDTLKANLEGNVVGGTVQGTTLSSTGLVYAQGGNSNNWNTAFDRSTQYQNVSSTFATNSTVNSVSSQLVLNTDFNNYKTNVAAATATLLPTTIYQQASGNWQGTFTNVQSNSANWILDGGNTKNSNITIGTNNYFNLNFETANSTRVTITSSGKTGFGGYPYAKVQYILADDPVGALIFTWDDRHVQMGSGSGPQAPGLGISYSSSNGTVNMNFLEPYVSYRSGRMNFGTMSWYSGGVTLGLTQDGSGNVGIGTPAPNEKLTVVGNVSATGTVYAEQGNSANWNTSFNRSTVFSSVSSRYNSTSTVVESNSANWNTAFNRSTQYQNASGNWESTYTTFSQNSGNYITKSMALAFSIAL